jgi:flagellar basal-body rod modification protein FlgD
MTSISPISSLSSTMSASQSSAAAAAAASSSAPTESEFLQLLVAQLKNQDPTSPQDPTQFVGELAQFSEVEQTVQIATNTTTMTQELAPISSSTTPTTNSTTGN